MDGASVDGIDAARDGNHAGPVAQPAPPDAPPPQSPIVLPGEFVSGSSVVQRQEATGD